MPPRLSKRQQREQDELLSLSTKSSAHETPDEPQPVESSEDEGSVVRPKPAGFSALAQPEVIEEPEEEVADAPQKTGKKKNKKKKKKEILNVGAATSPPISPQPQQAKAKKDAGKGKGKVDDGDELDKALAELSVKYPDLQHVAQSARGGSSAQSFSVKQNALLAVSLAHLDSEAEMRRFFGSKVISASRAQDKQPRGARAAVKGLKSNLTKPQATWWSASQREGLSIRPLTESEVKDKADRSKIQIQEKGERWWTVGYSKRYRNVTKAFISAVLSGDPERLYRILSKLPWHADTLLQISEIYRHREEHSSSVDFLNRALFTYERSFIGAFAFTAGINRLDFDHVENRPFYLALSRMVADLQRRGCSRTAFEFARLLLSLDPYTDPHGALLFLDFLAVRSGMHEWLVSLWDLHNAQAEMDNDILDTWNRFNVTILPGWSYARALALRVTEDVKKQSHEDSTRALEEAILSFPAVVPLLADKIDVYLPGELRGHSDFRVHVDSSSLTQYEPLIHLLSHLYAHRSFSLWKASDKAEWLKETALSVFNSYDLKKPNALYERFCKQFKVGNDSRSAPTPQDLYRSDLARSIFRHVGALADANTTRRLTAFFPRDILDAPALSCDPLPPHTAVSHYNDEFFADCEDVFAFRPRTRREREIDARNLARMIPDANVRHQLQVKQIRFSYLDCIIKLTRLCSYSYTHIPVAVQALYDARPDIQRQFPEGVTQFAQVAAQLGEDFWDNLLPQIIGDVGDVEARGGMPGQFVDLEFPDENAEAEHRVGLDAAAQDEQEVEGGDGDVTTNLDAEEESSDDDEEPVQTFPARIWQNLVNRFWGGSAPARGGNDGSETDDDESN
ncbi:DUF654-domain-containing protein [Fomitiporia mediterranea MF3/22]|uniref:DUF654-domain-containing protein n=1 Tax=Fomitiporia mediterranea (strain MF3/22) TaxID=694068 RepID=UPI0004407452|nr:DUF654-domain-containing protein [Fomitiporia mediterranea MF3/22]EJD00754.1 DUF654-domain-containing protein [Fomitiporia mediterranea MF3/22]